MKYTLDSKNIGFLRQWFNEFDGSRMVTNEDIITMLELKPLPTTKKRKVGKECECNCHKENLNDVIQLNCDCHFKILEPKPPIEEIEPMPRFYTDKDIIKQVLSITKAVNQLVKERNGR